MDNTRIYTMSTPVVSFMDRNDFVPKTVVTRERFNPYNPLSLQRSRRPLRAKETIIDYGYGNRRTLVDYEISSSLDMEAGNKEQHRGFKVDDRTMKLWRQYLTGKL